MKPPVSNQILQETRTKLRIHPIFINPGWQTAQHGWVTRQDRETGAGAPQAYRIDPRLQRRRGPSIRASRTPCKSNTVQVEHRPGKKTSTTTARLTTWHNGSAIKTLAWIIKSRNGRGGGVARDTLNLKTQWAIKNCRWTTNGYWLGSFLESASPIAACS